MVKLDSWCVWFSVFIVLLPSEWLAFTASAYIHFLALSPFYCGALGRKCCQSSVGGGLVFSIFAIPDVYALRIRYPCFLLLSWIACLSVSNAWFANINDQVSLNPPVETRAAPKGPPVV